MPKGIKKKQRAPMSNLSTGLPSDYKADERILAPIPGLVTQVFIKVGDKLKPGDPLLIIEAMKMHNMIRSGYAVTIASVHTTSGQIVKAGDLLVKFGKNDFPSGTI